MSGFDFKLDPIENFNIVFAESLTAQLVEPNAMALSTVSASGEPSVRVVLFKGLVRGGFSFYTNYNGKKAKDIESNPNVCVNFFWPTLERQIQISGQAFKLTRDESVAYFKTRPRLSQVGAWASHQSEVLDSFETIANRQKEIEKKFLNQEVPCPEHWGGYHIIPSSVEFWFGRKGRMHERFKYLKLGSGWSRTLLNP